MKVKDVREFIFENYYKEIGFTKKDNYYLLKKAEKRDFVLIATNLMKKNTWSY